jgi:ankyrin repeat protein
MKGALHAAIDRNDHKLIQSLIQAGANVNENAGRNGQLEHTPLEHLVSESSKRKATAQHSFALIATLLQAGAKLNQPTRWRSPPFYRSHIRRSRIDEVPAPERGTPRKSNLHT